MLTSAGELLAGSRRWRAGALIVAALILGVVTMHAMSGSSNAHLPPAAAVIATSDHHHLIPAPVEGEHASAATSAECADGSCAGHELVTAMCLMVLVALLALAIPGARAIAASGSSWAHVLHRAPPCSRPTAGPSLHALGISRT